MRARTVWLVKRLAALMAVCLVTFLAVRIWDSQRGLPLEPWHTYVPQELTREELESADWTQYLAAEQRIFDELRTEVTQKLAPEERVPVNRYFDGSPVYPGRFADDWNRSHVLEPAGAPVGAAVLLHGLTDGRAPRWCRSPPQLNIPPGPLDGGRPCFPAHFCPVLLLASVTGQRLGACHTASMRIFHAAALLPA